MVHKKKKMIIRVDWNDPASIRRAERQKAFAEGKGMEWRSEEMTGFHTSELVYEED